MIQIEAIQNAIQKADALSSKLTPEVMSIGGFTSTKIRHLMNNLGAISTSYLEIGSLRGATFCSTIFNNNNIQEAYSIDSFCEFIRSDEVHPMQEMISNVAQFKPSNTLFKLVTEDSWSEKAKRNLDGKKFDLFLYDGEHSYEGQRKALIEYFDFLDDIFVFCVDDYSWEHTVKLGTLDGLTDTRVSVLFEKELYNGVPSDATSWWNGYFVALLKKE